MSSTGVTTHHPAPGARTAAPSPGAPPRGIPLFHVGGILVRLDYSWIFVFLLVLVTLAVGYFPGVAPQQGAASYWAAGGVAALLFFASILVHELAHSWVAVRNGIPVPDITLFLFGGVSRMGQEARSPGVELRVAIVGPLMSLALALAFGLLSVGLSGLPWMLSAILAYLAWMNLALGVFNLLPGYPLDGGRVLRSLVWWRTGSLRRATRIASNAGQGLAVALMLLGGLQILVGGLIGGLWMILIGMFLRSMAKRGYEDLVLQRVLSAVDVEEVMVPERELVRVGPRMTLRELVDERVLAQGVRGFPVVEDGRTLGTISLDDVRARDRDTWERTEVREALRPLDESTTIAPDATLLEALERLRANGRQRLLVMRDGALVGLISAGRIARFVELRSLVKGDA